MKESFIKIIKWSQRYLTLIAVLAIGYIVFLTFFNESSVQSEIIADKIDSLKAEIRDNQDTLDHYNKKLHSLNTDPSAMERVVRENYHMQRPTEDVYVFE